MIDDTNKLVTKDYLKKFGDKSKLIFKSNPVHTKLTSAGQWVIISTKIDYIAGFDELYLNIWGITYDENIENKKILNSNIYVTTDSTLGNINFASGLNLGQEAVEAAVFTSETTGNQETLLIYLKLNDERVINESVIDVVGCKDNTVLFECINSVNYTYYVQEPTEYQQIAVSDLYKPFSNELIGTISTQFTGDIQFSVVDDFNTAKSYPETSVFNKILSSKQTDQLSHGLTFQYDWNTYISEEDDPVEVTNGQMVVDPETETALVKIPLPQLFEGGVTSDEWVNLVKVKDGIVTAVSSQQVPLASKTSVGGFYLADQNSELYTNQYPVKLNTEGVAYVNVPGQDVHRYTNLEDVPNPKILDIVQYIGTTTSAYVNGYFYQYFPVDFTANISSGSYWVIPDTPEDMANTIKSYNESNNYTLRPGIPITVALKPVTIEDQGQEVPDGTTITITDDTIFIVAQGDYQEEMSYGDLKDNFDINLKQAYTTYTYYHAHTEEGKYDAIISFNEAEQSTKTWVQKNVQPVASMQSALVYKGQCTWAELQEKTATATPGDFYIITDKSNQEYFFIAEGTWEFMGNIFSVDGQLTIKSQNNGTTTTVAEFTADQSTETSLQFVAGNNIALSTDLSGDDKKIIISATDTTYSAGTGLSLNNGVLNHSNSIESGAVGTPPETLDYGDSFEVPAIQYDSQGHITQASTSTITLPDAQDVNNGALTIQGNGVTATEFTANSAQNKNLNIKGTGLVTVQKTANGEITVSTTATNNAGTITKVGLTTSGQVTVSSQNEQAEFNESVEVGQVGQVPLTFRMPYSGFEYKDHGAIQSKSYSGINYAGTNNSDSFAIGSNTISDGDASFAEGSGGIDENNQFFGVVLGTQARPPEGRAPSYSPGGPLRVSGEDPTYTDISVKVSNQAWQIIHDIIYPMGVTFRVVCGDMDIYPVHMRDGWDAQDLYIEAAQNSTINISVDDRIYDSSYESAFQVGELVKVYFGENTVVPLGGSYGYASHTEGIGALAQNDAEHAQGKFNVSHTSSGSAKNNKTLHSVGIGTSLSSRLNAAETMQNGDIYVKGVGNYDGVHIKGEQGAPSNLKTLQEVLEGCNNVVVTNPSDVVNYNAAKYLKKTLLDSQDFVLEIDTSGEVDNVAITDAGAKEVIYRIDNASGDEVLISVDGGINMWDPEIRDGILLSAGGTMEVVITFWSPDDATFNGGVSADILSDESYEVITKD